MRKSVVIAVDGPSGSGKSTVSAALARSLGYDYINSGSLYRAFALKAMDHNISIHDERALIELVRGTVFGTRKDGSTVGLLMDGVDVDAEISRMDVAQASSIISVFRGVREAVNGILHGMVNGSTVVEGRDIGTVVFPSADIKFFVTASPEARAQRRYEELKKNGVVTTYEEVLSELRQRDMRDEQRDISPLRPAADAFVVDTTNVSINEVTAHLYNETRARLSQRYIGTVNGVKFYTTVSAGFCFGVRRAVDIAIKTAKRQKALYTLGPLIHNPQEVRRLEEIGVKAVEDINDISSGTLVYRSHGVTIEEADTARAKGFDIIDATCPFVTRSQRLVKALTRKGFHVVIVGDEGHPEVKGLLSYALPHRVTVVRAAEDLPKFWNIKKLAVLAQTTQSMENFKKVIAVLADSAYELAVYNTICDATKIRQEESALLARMVDVVLVVGGFNSSNTNKLANICKAINPKTYHIEHQDQITQEMLMDAKKVGITAGASTPIWLIKETLRRLKEIVRGLR
ncbi:MAG: 4-hydroxy-3-methylbut-2-enyl diphosphate reductase [Deltaproteobacteria bacterium]|nr:4-hydroxy-3-methylbut-2-enyl diphosphate reductase [Deltaproteobacteria bacterium]MCL5277527.1 4-hydroxy-3-methylbut-2-enyl diphosphate reductase [Deltaproteobacteria bacterium]